MCTFMTELPKHSKTTEQKQKNLYLQLMPSKEKEYYRFRLLWFKSPSKNDRDYPFIERYMHYHFKKDEEDKWQIESQVVCPATPHVRNHLESKSHTNCPVCNFANQNFLAYKESGYKDKESNRKNNEFKRKFEAVVPVYVVSDPNYDGNQGKLRVIKFTKKEDYKSFKDLVARASQENIVFNGKNAVDFFIRIAEVEEKLREGTPTEYVWRHKAIVKMGFTTKPYDIPAITKEAIDDFEFDDQFYCSSSMEELKDFYNTYCRMVNNDDIPDDEEIKVFKPTNPTVDKVKKTNAVESSEKFANESKTEVPSDDIDDLDELEEFGKPEDKKESKKESDGFETDLPFDDGTKSEDSDASDISMDDIDKLLEDDI